MAMALEAGDLVDQKYRIVRFIGRGAWASVYEGVNSRIGRRVAIKVLSDEAIQKPGIVERFEREAQAATRIDSPHVVHVFDLGVLADGRPYIVMELLEGANLGQALNERGSMSEGRAVFYTIQALRGLAEAHSAGVMHRDIKPDNMVLVTTKHGDEVLKIVDFGISKLQSGLQQASNMTQTNTVLGSPVYMSPEQCRGTKHMDHRSDLYSLGVVLFELLTGEVPHRGETFNELMFKIALEDTRSPAAVRPDLDPELCALVMKALKRDATERFQSAAEFEEALFNWANSHGIDTSTWFERRSRMQITGEVSGVASDSMSGGGKNSSQRRLVTASPLELAATKKTPENFSDSSGGASAQARPEAATAIEPTASAITNHGAAGTTVGTTTDMTPLPAKKRGWVIGAGIAAAALLAILVAFRLGGAGGSHGNIQASSGGTDPTATATTTAPATPTGTATATATVATTAEPTATASQVATATAEPPTGARPQPTVPIVATFGGRRPPVPTTPHSSSSPPPSAPPPTAPTAAPTASANSIVDGRRIRTEW